MKIGKIKWSSPEKGKLNRKTLKLWNIRQNKLNEIMNKKDQWYKSRIDMKWNLQR